MLCAYILFCSISPVSTSKPDTKLATTEIEVDMIIKKREFKELQSRHILDKKEYLYDKLIKQIKQKKKERTREKKQKIAAEKKRMERERKSYIRKFTAVVTAFTAGYESTGKRPGDKGYGITASGRKVQKGVTVACPASIKLGTWIKIEGIGKRRCDDRGSAIGKGRIDLYIPNLDKALRFGEQEKIIWILGG